ncbi:MAG TPA: ankyrin repeat domain-containing protein [Sphingomonadaceae bacterium]|nr:ankyrin repeat domain-containing protein [Sphingomonadaceae bacterium]
MARGSRIHRISIAAAAGALVFAAPAQAQYSDQYQFLQAVKEKDGEKVVELLSAPGSTLVNSRDLTTGETGLHIAVKRRDLTWVRFLLQQKANPDIRDVNGVTPLVLAAQLGLTDAAEALIKAGARVDIANSTGETPLIAAVHKRDVAIMRVLLKAGADPDRTDNSGRTARDYALLDGPNSQLVAEIEQNQKPENEREGANSYGPTF